MTMGATPDTRPSELSEGSGNDRKRIDYFYDALIGNFNYGEGHPMRPHRVRLTHNLVVRYGLFQHLNIFRPKPASKARCLLTRSTEPCRLGAARPSRV